MTSVWEQHGLLNGGVGVIRDGNLIYQRSAGWANKEAKVPNSAATNFNLASVSKPFTAIAVLQLVGEKKLGLDKPLYSYLPEFPYPTITVRHLLSHTSGLPEDSEVMKEYIEMHPEVVISNREVYHMLTKGDYGLVYAPGTRHGYNNLNFVLLGLAIEEVTDVPFATYMKEKVFGPAGMENTYVRHADGPNTARYFYPTYHDSAVVNVDSLDRPAIYTNFHTGGLFGSSNVMTTIEDMAAFDKALDDDVLLSTSLKKQMLSPTVLDNGDTLRTGGGKKTFALGWNLNTQNSAGKHVVWHDGSLVGHTTIFYKNFTDDVSLVMYENESNPHFFYKFLGMANVVEGLAGINVSLSKSLVREFGVTLVKEGTDAAVSKFNVFKRDTAYYMNEFEMNDLGYELLLRDTFSGHEMLALEVFKLNSLLFPDSSNAYDSYAEALMENGKFDEAIAMYELTLRMNPANSLAQENLAKLKKVRR
ncbi:serine hydrolase [Neolewinella xylanilytica]|nr:serine hydrolase [Neolewinella xylanilytica]